MPVLHTILFAFLFFAQMHGGALQNPGLKSPRQPAAGPKSSFMTAYADINRIINAKQWHKLNKYVHPEYGFYMCDNPGVRPVPYNYPSIDKLIDGSSPNEIITNKFLELRADKKHRLVSGKVPEWDCGTNRWNKKGNYCENILSYPGLAENVLYSPECNEDQNHPNVLKAKQFGAIIKKHVVQTDGYEIYFAYIDGKWYIAVIDVCDKCSA